MKIQSQWLGVDGVVEYFGGKIGRDRVIELIRRGFIKNGQQIGARDFIVRLKYVIEFDDYLDTITEPVTFDLSRIDKDGKIKTDKEGNPIQDILIITPVSYLYSGKHS